MTGVYCQKIQNYFVDFAFYVRFKGLRQQLKLQNVFVERVHLCLLEKSKLRSWAHLCHRSMMVVNHTAEGMESLMNTSPILLLVALVVALVVTLVVALAVVVIFVAVSDDVDLLLLI